MGASIEASADALLGAADLVVKINAPTPDEIAKTKPGAGFVSLLFPLVNTDLVKAMNARSLTAISLDRVPDCTDGRGFSLYPACLLEKEHHV